MNSFFKNEVVFLCLRGLSSIKWLGFRNEMKIITLYKICLKTLITKKVKFLPVIISSVEKQGLSKDFILLNLSLLEKQ